MNWSENMIARALALQFFNRKYLVVVPNCNYTSHECDLLCVTESLRVIDIEIKISRSDLKADAKKDKWWHRPGWEAYNRETGRCDLIEPTKLAWPPKVWKHYYALPAEIWTDELLHCLPSRNSGVLLLKPALRKYGGAIEIDSNQIDIVCKRKAAPNRDANPIPAAAAVNIARLASLRMWDAIQTRENLAREVRHARASADFADDGVRP